MIINLIKMITKGTTTFLQTYLPRRAFAAAATNNQMHLMLFGAPGVGKGTYSKLIEKEYDLPTFSMGEYFRGLINTGDTIADPFVAKLKETLRSG